MMDRSAEIGAGLVNLEGFLTALLRAKTITVLIQATQHSHPALGQREFRAKDQKVKEDQPSQTIALLTL
jgi:hypothetical protein